MSAQELSRRDENFIVFIAPLINSVAGIAIDLFAPSIPSIGREFAVSAGTMQNTITVLLLFYAVGQIFFGLLADGWGRRPAIVLGLGLFMLGSLCAALAPSIEWLMVGRGLQGFAIGACQVVSRALLVDNIRGDRFRVAVVYLSLAFGLGPVISPYLGGLIEEAAGWRWNFGLYFGYGAVVLAFVAFGLKESLLPAARRNPLQSIAGYGRILTDRSFLAAVLLLGSSFGAFLLWNVFGPHLVEERFGKGSAFFGTTALAVGCGYLVGTMLNRVLVKRFTGARLIAGGLALSALGVGLISSSGAELVLATLLGGTVLISFAQGFLFSNALARTMSLFPRQAGTAASLQGCVMLLIGAGTSAVVSTIPIESNATVAMMFGGLLAVSVVAAIALHKTRAAAPSLAPSSAR
jgi:MFS transporter, DHA1 family, multidrug resistance protein